MSRKAKPKKAKVKQTLVDIDLLRRAKATIEKQSKTLYDLNLLLSVAHGKLEQINYNKTGHAFKEHKD